MKNAPIKTPKDFKLSVRVSKRDLDLLKKNNIDVAALIRDALGKAASKL